MKILAVHLIFALQCSVLLLCDNSALGALIMCLIGLSLICSALTCLGPEIIVHEEGLTLAHRRGPSTQTFPWNAVSRFHVSSYGSGIPLLSLVLIWVVEVDLDARRSRRIIIFPSMLPRQHHRSAVEAIVAAAGLTHKDVSPTGSTWRRTYDADTDNGASAARPIDRP